MTSQANWQYICQLDDIPRQGARRVARPRGLEVALFRTAADAVYALLDYSPYKGGPLSQGMVFGDNVACPLHNWTIELSGGCAQAPDEGCTPRFSVWLDASGLVHLDAEELASRATELTRPVAGPSATARGCSQAVA